MNRREFLRCAGWALAGMGMFPLAVAGEDAAPSKTQAVEGAIQAPDDRFVRPAMFYEKRTDGRVQCRLCPRECLVGVGGRGHCGVRENRDGDYVTLVYGRAAALNNDPIEKKPFNHFRPGSMVLSVATAGCNLSCKYCQNWQISQFRPEEVNARHLPPEKLVELAVANNIPNIAFTYNEPTVFFEYMYETVQLGRKAGLKGVVVSNGFINPEPIKALAPHLAAYKVDLKSFSAGFYRDVCGGERDPVLNTLKTLIGQGVWVEIVNLVLPTLNDSEEDIRRLAEWVRANLGASVPIHFTRFHPMYKIRNLPPTPVSTLETCCEIAKAQGLHFVYLGNVPGHPRENTYCPRCGRLLIERTGLWSVKVDMEQGRCPACRAVIPGVWS